MTMTCARFSVPLLTLAMLAWGAARPVAAQPTLERLEKSIRERTDGEAKPAAAGQKSGYLGLTADDANDRGRGVRVLAVRPGGPAAAAGLKPNDLITAIAGVRVRQMSDMADIMALFPAGDTVALDVQRDGKQQQMKVTLAQPLAAKEAAKDGAKPAPKPEAKPQAAAEELPAAGPELTPPRPKPLLQADAPEVPPRPKPLLPADAPEVPPRPKPLLPAAAPPTVEQLQRRIEQLERRVEQLEKALAEAKKPS
jgi:hypothetical protein